MAKRTKVPRASLACTILDDVEYIRLIHHPRGRDAFALFVGLLCAAKVQGNEGVFLHEPFLIASLCRWPMEAFDDAFETLLSTEWVNVVDGKVIIRNYKKWNAWGGKREGAGRKPKAQSRRNSSLNQNGKPSDSKPATPVSDSDTGTNYSQSTPAGEAGGINPGEDPDPLSFD